MTSNIIITYNSYSESISEGKSNIKMENLDETKFLIEHDFQMMNLGSRMTS